MRAAIETWVTARWYGASPGLLWVLWPFEILFYFVVRLRYGLYAAGVLRAAQPPVPVIVVGNIVAGGAGKTPVIAALVRELAQQGLRPGIISRGYGREGTSTEIVRVDAPVRQVGDEPLMLARETGVPVAVSSRRAQGAQALLAAGCDILLADDGLQHYALGRDIEIAVIPGTRREGNGHLLPLGPLREPRKRLQRCHFRVVVNGRANADEYALQGQTGRLLPLEPGANPRTLADFAGQPVLAVAGIAHPEAFFTALSEAGLDVETRRYPDHHHFCAADLTDSQDRPVILTSKDAVKCDFVSGREVYALEYTVNLPEKLMQALLAQVRAVSRQKKVRS